LPERVYDRVVYARDDQQIDWTTVDCLATEGARMKLAADGGPPPAHEDGFLCWFGQSVVVDEAGLPLRLYHATTDPWFVPEIRHGMGPHFGDRETALARMEQRAADALNEGGIDDDSPESPAKDEGLLIVAFLRIERPVLMRDVHFDELPEFVLGLLETGIVSLLDLEEVCGDQEYWYVLTEKQNSDAMRATVSLLIDRGYDGIAYHNLIEGGGALSWIPFTLPQIWEAEAPEDR
jgi:hypothetical protein